MKYYLGIDLGTSSIKVSLADEKGNIIDSESSSYPLILPKPNWSEQDPNEWRLSLIEVNTSFFLSKFFVTLCLFQLNGYSFVIGQS